MVSDTNYYFRRALGRGAAASVLLAGCSRGPAASRPLFTDVTKESGIEFHLTNGASAAKRVLETMAGGLAWIDYDGDGDYDLYLVNGHSDTLHADEPGAEEDRLFRNDGKGRFTDVTRSAFGTGDRRYGLGAAAADFDNDGDADLLVTNFGRNSLFRNSGDGTFLDVTEAAGIVARGFHTSAAWFDADRDGDLDLYVCRYLRYDPKTARACRERDVVVSCHPKFFPGEADLLYRNRGDGTFEEVGKKAGIAVAGDDEGKGLGVVAFDFDRDGWTDVFVANDTTPNFLWRNRHDGTFADVAQEVGVALSAEGKAQAGMGVDVADADGDGWTDIYVANFASELNALYLSRRGGEFVESSRTAGLGSTFVPLGFGNLFIDADLDGDEDIVTLNGHINDVVEATDPGTGSTYRQAPSLFLNRGGGVFEDGRARGGAFFAERRVGRGLARCDFDGDGDVDLACMSLDGGLVLLRNESAPDARSATLRLVGTKSPRDAYGARVEAEVAGRLQVFEVGAARSYLSSSDPRVVVALGSSRRIDRLKIAWPSGSVEERRDIAVEGPITIVEGR